MTTAMPLSEEAHLDSGVDSRPSNSTATDRNLSQVVENPLETTVRFQDSLMKLRNNRLITGSSWYSD